MGIFGFKNSSFYYIFSGNICIFNGQTITHSNNFYFAIIFNNLGSEIEE